MTKDKPQDLSDEALTAATGGALARGSYVLPEVDDEVLVGFLDADPRNPLVVGGLWNGSDSAPSTPSVGAGQTTTLGANTTDTVGGKGR